METTSSASSTNGTFLGRHEFLIRRLHSLTGLIPVGAFMTVHLTVNLTAWEPIGGTSMYQRAVYQIHSLQGLLPLVEWAFIFVPILFHAIIGVVIVLSGMPNNGSYPYPENTRYSLQRVTGILAFVFIVYHVFHMHGWFHFDVWLEQVVRPLGGARFAPYNAGSSLNMAMRGVIIPLIYGVGVLSCVFHLANGLWTMGITWGLWTSPAAQRRAQWACNIVGVLLLVVAVGAFVGALTIDGERARITEDKMYKAKVNAGILDAEHGEHKRLEPAVRVSSRDE